MLAHYSGWQIFCQTESVSWIDGRTKLAVLAQPSLTLNDYKSVSGGGIFNCKKIQLSATADGNASVGKYGSPSGTASAPGRAGCGSSDRWGGAAWIIGRKGLREYGASCRAAAMVCKASATKPARCLADSTPNRFPATWRAIPLVLRALLYSHSATTTSQLLRPHMASASEVALALVAPKP